MKHAERLLRKVHLNNDGSADIHWKDYYTGEDGLRTCHEVDRVSNEKKAKTLLIHEDFRKAWEKLHEHWLIREEETPEPKANYPFDGTLKNMDRVTVTSITFSGGEPVDPDSGEERSPVAVHIQGTMKLNQGGVKNMCTPPIKMGAPAEKYKFATHLDQHLQVIEEEVWAYVSGSKFTPPKNQQVAMAFEAGPGGADVQAIGAGESADEAEEGSTREEAMAAANTTPVSDGQEV